MRIALVSREYPPFYGGGIGTYARHIAPALASEGHDVHVVTQSYDETHPRIETIGRLTVHRVPAPGDPAGWTSKTMRFAVLAGRVVSDLARRGAIDVAEFAECEGAGAVYTTLRASGLTQRGGVGAGVPAVIHLHTPTEMLFRLGSIHEKRFTGMLAAYFLAERQAMLHADHICAPSHFIAGWARDHYGLASTPTVIPYAIPGLPEIPSGVERRKRVLFVGRIEPRKGVGALLRAWERVARERPGWTLRLIGADTSTAAEGRSLRAELESGLSDSARRTIEFRDALPPAMLAREYAAASVCVIPSLWENFPNVCIEAMSFGRPVIVSDQGGMKEMIGGTAAGETFRSGDPESLAEAIVGMLSESTERLSERGRIGRLRIGSICEQRAVAAQRIAMYEQAIESASRGGVAVEQRDSRLRHWRRMRSAAQGNSNEIGLPALDDLAARWLGASSPEGAAA